MIERSGLSQAYVVKQKQIIFFMISSLIKEARHIQEKTGEASIPKVIYPITFLMTSFPFFISFQLITLLSWLNILTHTFSINSFILFSFIKSTVRRVVFYQELPRKEHGVESFIDEDLLYQIYYFNILISLISQPIVLYTFDFIYKWQS